MRLGKPSSGLRGLISELDPTTTDDRVPTECVANFDNLHILPRALLPAKDRPPESW